MEAIEALIGPITPGLVITWTLWSVALVIFVHWALGREE